MHVMTMLSFGRLAGPWRYCEELKQDTADRSNKTAHLPSRYFTWSSTLSTRVLRVPSADSPLQESQRLVRAAIAVQALSSEMKRPGCARAFG